MLLTAVAVLLICNPIQSVDGIKPVFDPGPKFAQALAKRANDDPAAVEKPDTFTAAYFMGKARTMAPLMQTKYTAAQMGICGTILNLYDESLGGAIKSGADRISKGSKDFDSLTDAEQQAIKKAISASPLALVLGPKTTQAEFWQYMAGSYVGMLSAYTTVWHISPKQESLLSFIADGVKGCAEHGAKPESKSSTEVAEALKGFGKFSGKKLDEATMREIGAQIEVTLKAATPAKYRW